MSKFLLIISLFVSSTGFGQRKAIPLSIQAINKQREKSYTFFECLQDGRIADAVQLLDTTFNLDRKRLGDTLAMVAKAVQQVCGSAALSVTNYESKDGFMTYRCHYSLGWQTFFLSELTFNAGEPSAAIRYMRVLSNQELRECNIATLSDIVRGIAAFAMQQLWQSIEERR